jgi:CBS domain-containing protein
MNRRDAHLDAMLRHLGAAYYDSLHGRAARTDVRRAFDSVAEHLDEKPVDHSAQGSPAAARHDGAAAGHDSADTACRHGAGHSRVRDIMTTSVVTVDRITPYKEIARLLVGHKISGVPVLTMGRNVVGVVSEGDLLAAQDHNPATHSGWRHWTFGRELHQGRTADLLMTSPAVTIHPDATITAAARLMNSHHIRRLPVVDADGTLAGIVSRRDLLSIFLRPDADIAWEVGEILTDVLPGGPTGVEVAVRNGVVTLTGQPELASDEGLISVAVRLASDVDGVVDVVNKIGLADGRRSLADGRRIA